MTVKGLKVGSLNTSDDVSGLVKIVPTSVAVGSGSGSADSLGNITFTSASSVSLNGIFSSTFTVYRILLNVTTASGALDFRLRASGSDNTSAVYSNYSHYGRSGNANAVLTANENATIASMIDNMSAATYDSMDIFNPNINTNTSLHFQGLHIAPATAGYRVMAHWGGLNHNTNYQADGCTFVFGGASTGNIRVFGYTQ